MNTGGDGMSGSRRKPFTERDKCASAWEELLRTSKEMLAFYDELLAENDAYPYEEKRYAGPFRKAIAKVEDLR